LSVFVLDKKGKPLMPCSEKRARLLLERRRARVHRVVPFVIRLVDREQSTGALQPVRVKLDPGSKVTGIALVRESESVDTQTGEIQRDAVVLNLMDLEHRGAAISGALTARARLRRGRRSRKLRYRAPRFDNRTKPDGWLAPSLRHRVETTMTWVRRLRRWAPVAGISMELVRFDLQKLENPDISDVEYQQGTLVGYEVREYVLFRGGHQCAYCDKTDCVLNLDHVKSRARGGSDRVSNLVPACIKCNQDKKDKTLEEFVKDPARRARIEAQLKAPLKDAAAVNSTRWALFGALKATGLPVECGSGGRTKWNRVQLGLPKTHALDAACVGRVDAVAGW
jgi:5-methylcytosine-specific restriction endonuclease McrA